MTDIVLFAGKLLFLALLYLFLVAAVRAGIGRIGSAAPVDGTWRLGLVVTEGPPELRGIKLDLSETVLIGREAGSDLVIADDFVSTNHARILPTPKGPVLTDLDSTNGTVLNGRGLRKPTVLRRGDRLELGKVVLEVRDL